MLGNQKMEPYLRYDGSSIGCSSVVSVCQVTSLLVMLERSGVARAGASRVKGTNGTFLAFREVAHLTVTATGVGVSFNRPTLLCS